jgi:hypothetical protein
MFGDQSCKTFDTHGVGESENIVRSQQEYRREDDANRCIGAFVMESSPTSFGDKINTQKAVLWRE